MAELRLVIDTNVLVSALRSRVSGSHRFLLAVGQGLFDIVVSVPLVMEYEAAAERLIGQTALTAEDIGIVIDYLCSVAIRQQVYYLWRPFLPDPKDDMVLEVAVAAGCRYIVTFNRRDFRGVERFGVSTIEPGQLLELLGVEK